MEKSDELSKFQRAVEEPPFSFNVSEIGKDLSDFIYLEMGMLILLLLDREPQTFQVLLLDWRLNYRIIDRGSSQVWYVASRRAAGR